MSVLHLAAIRRGGRKCASSVCARGRVRDGSYFVLQRRSAARLFSGRRTGVPSFWLPPCVAVVSSAPVSPSPIYDDQNTLLTAECSAPHSPLPQPPNVP